MHEWNHNGPDYRCQLVFVPTVDLHQLVDNQREEKMKEVEQVCRNCSKALRALEDYTCKETCHRVFDNDTCKKFKQGVPVGGRQR